jgi:hypothetical protein
VRPEGAITPVRVATTGINGSFAFEGLTDGRYRVEAYHEGYVPDVKTGVQVRAPFRAVVEIMLTRGATPVAPPPRVEGTASLSGQVRVARGEPLPEARVRLTRGDGGDEARSMLTDGSGRFSVEGLKAGRWNLEIQGAGWLPLRADLDLAGSVAVEVQLAAQPASYKPPPRDLIVPEEVLPPRRGESPTSAPRP